MDEQPRVSFPRLLLVVAIICLAWGSGLARQPASAEENPSSSLADMPVRVRHARPVATTTYLCPRLNPRFELLAYLATTVDEAGNLRRDLWVTDLATMKSQRLTSYSQCFDVAWSSDGTWLAVSAERSQLEPPRGGLYLMRSDGSGMTEVLSTRPEDVPTSPAWQPGRPEMIAFISSMETASAPNPLHRHLIWLVNTAASGPEALTCFSLPERLSLSTRSGLAWSNDGASLYLLAADANEGGKVSIWMLSVADGSAKKVLDEPDEYEFSSLAVCPPPGPASAGPELVALLMTKKGPRPAAEAYVSLMTPRTGGLRRLGSTVLTPEELRTDFTSSMSWNGPGRRLAYVRDREIWTMDLATPQEAAVLDCRDNLAALHRAFAAYAKEHNGLLPSPDQDKEGKWRAGGFFWVDALAPFMQVSDVLKCNPRETEPSSYLFNRDLWGKSMGEAGAVQQSPLLTEAQARHDGRRNVLLLNGTIRLEAG